LFVNHVIVNLLQVLHGFGKESYKVHNLSAVGYVKIKIINLQYSLVTVCILSLCC